MRSMYSVNSFFGPDEFVIQVGSFRDINYLYIYTRKFRNVECQQFRNKLQCLIIRRYTIWGM